MQSPKVDALSQTLAETEPSVLPYTVNICACSMKTLGMGMYKVGEQGFDLLFITGYYP